MTHTSLSKQPMSLHVLPYSATRIGLLRNPVKKKAICFSRDDHCEAVIPQEFRLHFNANCESSNEFSICKHERGSVLLIMLISRYEEEKLSLVGV